MPDRIHAQHPAPDKQGTTIDAAKYHAVRDAIVAALGAGPVAFEALIEAVEDAIGDDFDGSIPWYVTTVKLDLEARGTIERVPGQRPQHLRLA